MVVPTLLMTVERYRTNLSLQDIVMYNGSIYLIESIYQYKSYDP